MSFARILRPVLIWGGLAAAAWFGYQHFYNRPPEIAEYRTTPVIRTALVQKVTATGELTALVLVQVGSQLSGTISELHADFNSQVKQGQILAKLDPATYKANLAQNEGELANAEAELQLAKLNAQRKKQLLDKGLAPIADYDKAVADLTQAEAGVKIRSAILQKTQVDLTRCTIYAPIDGMVISRKVDVGQTVAASMNAPVLFEIAKDLTSMEIHASVAEADVGGLAEGQEVTFTVNAYPDETFHGVVKQVRNSPTTVENVVHYDTVIAVENKQLKLKPGMTSLVSIILSKRENVLALPNAALRFKPETTTASGPPADKSPAAGGPPGAGAGGTERPRGGGEGGGRRGGGGASGGGGGRRKNTEGPPTRTVYVIDKPGTATVEAVLKPITVQTGIDDGNRTEIVSGLEENQEIVSGTVFKTSSDAASAGQNGASNPFRAGGGGGGGFRR
ncbi:MAG: efflux RND transporter periplasmic adaptor subunit [Verrucomicrobiota bacterium]